MEQSIIQVDAFTKEKFKGNPAAVCILEKAADEKWMQDVALEMNLSETAFLYPVENGYDLRWFTPVAEVDLCGHATLATAHVLFLDKHVSKDTTISFHTRSGELKVSRDEELIYLDFPALPPERCIAPEGLLEALGVDSTNIYKSKFDLLVEVDSEDEIKKLEPDFTALAKCEARGVIVTAKAKSKFDFISRFFAPAFGINEDPVTGSAHCVLAPYWSKKLGKENLFAYQASSRGGEVRLEMKGDRVILGGQAVITLRGVLK